MLLTLACNIIETPLRLADRHPMPKNGPGKEPGPSSMYLYRLRLDDTRRAGHGGRHSETIAMPRLDPYDSDQSESRSQRGEGSQRGRDYVLRWTQNRAMGAEGVGQCGLCGRQRPS